MMKEGRESTPSPRRAICCNRQQRVMILALLILKSSMQVTFGFVGPINVGKGARSWSKTTSLYDIEPDTEEDSLTASTSAIWNWNAANSSLGSLLLQLQKEEEEEMKRAIGQSPNSTAFKITTTTSYDAPPPPPSPSAPQNELVAMDLETARELDDAVKKGIKTELLSGIEVLPTSSLYSTLTKRKRKLSTKMSSASRTRLFRPMKREQREFDAEILTMPLSMPEHYDERITRDMRHLAVSISSNVDEVWQWRLFCKQKGGIVPLLKCIQEGARFIREHINERGSKEFEFTEFAADQHEETFMAACTACRALRDLCAISPELSAVITDGILRSNDLWETGPLSDFVTLLQHTEVEIKREARDFFSLDRRNRRDARRRCKLYVLQLLEAMSDASDDAIHSIRSTPGLADAVLASSSYARIEKTRRWLRYPGKLFKMWSRRDSRNDDGAVEDIAGRSRPFIEAAALPSDLRGQVQEKANLVLAAIGYNAWVPKIPGQKGLRILCMDGGGTRGMAAVTTLRCLVEGMGGVEACEAFDMIAGTSTGAIIAFLVGLRKETSGKAKERYDALIKRIFVKSAWSSPLMLFTTATYDEQPFMEILSEILGDKTMLDSRADPTVPRVFAVASKMSSTPTHVCLFRNYNYASGELPDPFTVDPDAARRELELPVELDGELAKSYARTRRTTYEDKPYITGTKLSPDASRYPGSFRVLQRHALRASTAAPTVFKPVFMNNEVYCDGGIVASNPTAVAIHEARTLFPDVPIEMVVSIGTGGFTEVKSAPKIGWDGIIGQIVDSACDGEQTHHILEDILGGGMGTASSTSKTNYYRLNPVIGAPDEFPIDGTDPELLARLAQITSDYMAEPEQREKLQEIRDILDGRRGLRRLFPRRK